MFIFPSSETNRKRIIIIRTTNTDFRGRAVTKLRICCSALEQGTTVATRAISGHYSSPRTSDAFGNGDQHFPGSLLALDPPGRGPPGRTKHPISEGFTGRNVTCCCSFPSSERGILTHSHHYCFDKRRKPRRRQHL